MTEQGAPLDFCFICGHIAAGHADYNRKGDGSVDHDFVSKDGVMVDEIALLNEGRENGAGRADDRGSAMTEDEIGRLAHAAWKAWRIKAGYPDHAWNRGHVRRLIIGHGYPSVEQCTICVPVDAKEHPDFAPRMSLRDSHHEDMADWDTLADSKKRKYIGMGLAGFEARQGEEEMRALTSQARSNAQALADLCSEARDERDALVADVRALRAENEALLETVEQHKAVARAARSVLYYITERHDFVRMVHQTFRYPMFARPLEIEKAIQNLKAALRKVE